MNLARLCRRALAAIVTVAAIAGCGSDDDAATSAVTDAPAPPTAVAGAPDTTAPTPGPTTASAPPTDVTVDPDATVRFAYLIAPSQGFDPHRSPLTFDLTWLAPIYDSLVREAPDGSLQPGLATAWTFVDDTTLELALREGVTFQDGVAFDAEAVRANLDRAMTLPGSTVAPQLAAVEEVEVVDPLTVRLHLAAPAATLPRILADRPGMMISPGALADVALGEHPVGAGMFRLVDYVPGASAAYERFDGYWNPDDVRFQRLEIVVQGDSLTRWNAVRSGQADLTVVDPAEFSEAEGEDFQTVAVDSTIGLFLQLNRTRAEFGDVRVRQAMNMAIDRDAIASSLYADTAIASPQFYPPSYDLGHVPDVEDAYPFDVDAARALLAEAGLPDGFTFEAVVPTIPSYDRLAEVIQAQLAEIGITMTITGITPGTGGSVFYVDQRGDALLGSYQGTTDPALLAQLYYGATSLSNPGGDVPDGVAAALDRALRPLDDDARRAALHDLMALTVTTAGNVIVNQTRSLVVATPALVDVDWTLRGGPDFRGMAVGS